MVAVITGSGLGQEKGSGSVLGSRGALGDATFGRYGEKVTVNAATGNLMINRADEMLIGRGPDDAIVRSYNSLGMMTDDNGDNWILNAQRHLEGTGTVNVGGSVRTLVDWDGSRIDFVYDTSQAKYISNASARKYSRDIKDAAT